MRNLADWENIEQLVISNLQENGFSLENVDMTYIDGRVDFIFYSVQKQLFIRVDDSYEEINIIKIGVVIEDENNSYIDVIVHGLKIFGNLFQAEIEVIEKHNEAVMELSFPCDEDNDHIAFLISKTIAKLWPYLLGSSYYQNNEEENGKIYITESVPERNGKVKLIKQRIGDSALQLFFLLPDEKDHYVHVESYDSAEPLDSNESYCKNQFRFLAFPKSPESSIIIKVFIDGDFAYGRRFKVPFHLRTKRKYFVEKPITTSNIGRDITKGDNDPLSTEIKNNQLSYIDLNIEIGCYEISIEAEKILKAQKYLSDRKG